MAEMETCQVQHCYRETNALADELAGMCVNDRVVEMDIENLSDKCNAIINSDKCGKLYERVH